MICNRERLSEDDKKAIKKMNISIPYLDTSSDSCQLPSILHKYVGNCVTELDTFWLPNQIIYAVMATELKPHLESRFTSPGSTVKFSQFLESMGISEDWLPKSSALLELAPESLKQAARVGEMVRQREGGAAAATAEIEEEVPLSPVPAPAPVEAPRTVFRETRSALFPVPAPQRNEERAPLLPPPAHSINGDTLAEEKQGGCCLIL
jgi:hypothetical protein